MAVAHVLTFRWLSKLPSCQAALQFRPARYYGLQKKMTREERHELAEYRRKVTDLRKEFLEEWRGKVRGFFNLIILGLGMKNIFRRR